MRISSRTLVLVILATIVGILVVRMRSAFGW